MVSSSSPFWTGLLFFVLNIAKMGRPILLHIPSNRSFPILPGLEPMAGEKSAPHFFTITGRIF